MIFVRLIRSALRVGPFRLFPLLLRKCVKRARLARMFRAHPNPSTKADWNVSAPVFDMTMVSDEERRQIIARADAMLRDENTFFSFPYHLIGIERAWEFDPLEKKHWPRRHYSEKKLHAPDTPGDVKIVWEINRFKDLPTLGQAFALTGDERYAREAIRRMVSWSDGNPFATTVNWASALEISIRLISWTTTLALIRSTRDSHSFEGEEIVRQSIFKQARYLAADLSTDKVVPTNHLIGEAAGLFVIASLWKFPGSARYVRRAKRILGKEIVRQTFDDGVTREATSWYHQFVTDFCDLADRVGAVTGNLFEERFRERLASMKAFLETMIVDGNIIRYGDADDGWDLWLEGDQETWKYVVFGPPPTIATKPSIHYYPYASIVAAPMEDAFLFMRAGVFGMGGAGYASHAHDDFLSPIIYLVGLPVLVDSGTFVYNGNPKDRNRFRVAESHNGIVFNGDIRAEPRQNFGWNRVRPSAKMLGTAFTAHNSMLTAQYGERPEHQRTMKVNQKRALIVDRFERPISVGATWYFHFHPQWSVMERHPAFFRLQNNKGQTLSVTLRGDFDGVELAPYDFSPAYGVQASAMMLRCSAGNPSGVYAVLLAIESST